ncbi:hypothetical protein BP6252_13261 [Coleophoma cylindrospora]|uniref:Uncharacterized protein n=1 Tax=Coleophoma cylindrospora TaxID=1849047 RepID=A0A3D8QAC0_9HELO|nr:hypothetical protein BP6252_13261 [Coleophoma cylindrospora]
MEALSTLGLGAAIIEFAQYTDKHCQIFRSFCDDKYNDFQEGLFVDITRHFRYFAAVFKPQQPTGSDAQGQEALDMLIEGCQKIAANMRATFYKMAKDEVVKNNNIPLVLRIKKAKEFWNESEVYRMLAKLEGYRKQVAPCMLATVPAHVDAMDQEESVRLGTKYRSYGKVAEILAVVVNSLESLRIDDKEHNPNQHEPAMAAVVTFKSGETRTLTRTGMITPYSHNKQLKIMVLHDTYPVPMLDDFTSIQNLVLRSLVFPKFDERIKLVKDAHHETYEWAFCPPEAGKPWSPLVEWLEAGTGCYYIKGKPGSGKSTLMKFIAQHKRLGTALGKWAGNTLISASFFFWNLGSPLQKSSFGLLRGLLYDILSQHPWLISVAMPELWRAAAYLPAGGSLGEPSLEVLKQCFLKISDNGWDTGIKFFFMLDGIDEFESDHKELVNLLHKVVENGNVKILLSSRPTPLSEDSFSRWPSLRLQDLTEGDIRKYAEDHLSIRVKQKRGDQWAALIDEITYKSYGVFLWVILVVASLEEGFVKGDNIQEMRNRLVELPSDLKPLYDHIFQHLELRYQVQASELFQLLLKAQQVQSSAGYPLLMQLSFCASDAQEVMELPMGPIDPEICQDKLDEINRRIRSRSCGLIESRKWQTNRISVTSHTPITSQFVDFIHRTVVEFLLLPEVWKQLMTLTTNPKHKYDPSPELFRSCVIMCKTLPTPRGIEPEISTLWHMADRALVFASMAEDSGNPVPPEHLKELDTVVTTHWTNVMNFFSRLGTCDRKGHWAEGYKVDPQRQHLLHPNSFASVALFHGLEDYLTKELSCGTTGAALDTTMLLYTCMKYIGAPPWDVSVPEFDGSLTSEALLFLDRQAVLRPRWANIAICLLESNRTDPNKPVIGSDSAWSVMVSYLIAACAQHTKQTIHRDLEAKDDGFANTFAKLLNAFIQCGVDLEFCPVAGAEPAWKLVEQLFSDEPSSSQRINPWARQPVVEPNTQVMRMRDYFKLLVQERRGLKPS